MKSGCLAGYLASCCSKQYKPETGPCCTDASQTSGFDLETTEAPENRMPTVPNDNSMAATHRACFYTLVTLDWWLNGCICFTCLVRTSPISEIWLRFEFDFTPGDMRPYMGVLQNMGKLFKGRQTTTDMPSSTQWGNLNLTCLSAPKLVLIRVTPCMINTASTLCQCFPKWGSWTINPGTLVEVQMLGGTQFSLNERLWGGPQQCVFKQPSG